MSELESDLSQLDLNAATCLLTEDEIVTSLQNTANLFSARRVLVEAAQIFDENNKTIQPFNLTTQVDNYETTAKEYQEIIENKVLLEAFTKTIDQSIILDHVLKDDYGQNSDASENQIKVLFESNQLESLVTHLNDNEGVEKESQVRDLLENKRKITETLPRLKENFKKTEKDKDNIEMFNKASKYLKNMELMRNITQRLLAEYKFSEVKNDPELWAIHMRMLQRKTLTDYYKSTETGEANLDVNTENNSIAEERDNSIVEDIPGDNSMTEPNESVHSPHVPNNASARSRPVRTSVPNVGPANAAVESAPNEGQPNVSMKSVPNTSFRSGRNATFRSGLLDGSRLTRNEVSGIARLALNDTESDALNISEVNPTGVNRTEIGLDESLEMESEDEATSEKEMEQDEDESDLDEFVGKEELEEVFDEEEYEYEEIVEEEIADEEEGDEIEEEEEGEELPEDEEGGEEVENGGEERMEVDRQERLDESGEYEEEITEYEEIVEEEEEEEEEVEEREEMTENGNKIFQGLN
ncbi:reticulocyte-binding protein 2 homolog a isoform X2 [Diaphorina citri]|uniref:Reticulocyte-binding protein 2 homolog a isoform X2 n=1 Tax=Diaphorina citri TaxID=121845 RepID=A0A3Q0JNH1_DIACI|nr:reticulocyte-binding protein 2 homolog a isoform X2 [Diaphorina citri]